MPERKTEWLNSVLVVKAFFPEAIQEVPIPGLLVKGHVDTPHSESTRMKQYILFFEAVISTLFKNSMTIIFNIQEAEKGEVPRICVSLGLIVSTRPVPISKHKSKTQTTLPKTEHQTTKKLLSFSTTSSWVWRHML